MNADQHHVFHLVTHRSHPRQITCHVSGAGTCSGILSASLTIIDVHPVNHNLVPGNALHPGLIRATVTQQYLWCPDLSSGLFPGPDGSDAAPIATDKDCYRLRLHSLVLVIIIEVLKIEEKKNESYYSPLKQGMDGIWRTRLMPLSHAKDSEEVYHQTKKQTQTAMTDSSDKSIANGFYC